MVAQDVLLSQRPTISDRYFGLLVFCLFGYALLGKGFAYAGVPPVFIGEILLAIGVAVFLRSGTLIASLGSPLSLLVAALMVWVLLQTVPYIGRHGINALRDSVIAMYGVFTFIVIGLLLEAPQRLQQVVALYRRFAVVFILAMPFIYVFFVVFRNYLPEWPGTGIPILALRGGEVAVHVAGACIFALLGFLRPSRTWLLMLVFGALIVCTQSRGGMLAILIPLALAVVLGGKLRRVVWPLATALVLLSVAYALDLGFSFPGSYSRSVEVRQAIDNFASIFFPSGTASLDGTKKFRVEWWTSIVDYTVHGQYFWTGKGFGVNLAEADGFVVGTENDGPPLRSPHNAHMTVLARAGVPGLLLWGLLCTSWLATMLGYMVHAWRRQEPAWANLFLFVACYAASILINASFDVALEGPMLGIWFWALIGLGIGATMIYRRECDRTAAEARRRALARLAGLAVATALAGGLPLATTPAAAAEKARLHPVPPGSVLSNPDGHCLHLEGLADAVIEDIEIGPCGRRGISLADSRRVLIRNVTVRDTGESGIYILASEDVEIVDSHVENAANGIFAQESRRIRVDCNTVEDVRGPVPTGQFVQFNTVRGPGNRISCNIGRNRPGRGQPEDAISLYKSTGLPGAPILVTGNLIIGGGPSESGGGIMLGDAGGAHLAAIGNVLVDPGQYGIGVASGTDIVVRDNLVLGRTQPFTNVGIYVWNQYPHRCGNVTVAGNRVTWHAKTGRPNPWWDGRNCGAVTGLESNDFKARLTYSIAGGRPAQCRCGRR